MEYGTTSNFRPARENHSIGLGSSTDASNKIICSVYQAWLFLCSVSGLYCECHGVFVVAVVLSMYTISFCLLTRYEPTIRRMPEMFHTEKVFFKCGTYAVQGQAYTLMLLSTRNGCLYLSASIVYSKYLSAGQLLCTWAQFRYIREVSL